MNIFVALGSYQSDQMGRDSIKLSNDFRGLNPLLPTWGE
jgi:hypothetical protein